jgi:hypothetical protein
MLKLGYSRATVAFNIRKELQSGRPRSQAVAIALSVARKAKAKTARRAKR